MEAEQQEERRVEQRVEYESGQATAKEPSKWGAAKGAILACQQTFQPRLDLQGQKLRVDAGLRKAAGDEPQTGLAGR